MSATKTVPMKYIECPNLYRKRLGEVSLFLGGGITSCPQWQSVIVHWLNKTKLILLNPRRTEFDVTDSNVEVQQIKWEFSHMQRATAIMFWFPCETLCPITLFELGKWIITDKKMFIGCHPEYKRKRDVQIQVGLVRTKQIIHESLESMIAEIIRWTK